MNTIYIYIYIYIYIITLVNNIVIHVTHAYYSEKRKYENLFCNQYI